MSLRASDIEATALGAAAAAGIALKEHGKHCLQCDRALKDRKRDQCCPEGYEMALTIHKASQVIEQIREDKRQRKSLQFKLF